MYPPLRLFCTFSLLLPFQFFFFFFFYMNLSFALLSWFLLFFTPLYFSLLNLWLSKFKGCVCWQFHYSQRQGQGTEMIRLVLKWDWNLKPVFEENWNSMQMGLAKEILFLIKENLHCQVQKFALSLPVMQDLCQSLWRRSYHRQCWHCWLAGPLWSLPEKNSF